jgi:hypothetical protein
MISSTRREALAVLAEVVDLSDDVRLGQLFAHLGFLGADQTGRTLWDIDDEQLLAVLYQHRAELMGRTSGLGQQASILASGNTSATPIAGKVTQ